VFWKTLGKYSAIITGAIIGLGILLIGVTSWTIVRPEYVGVSIKLGRVSTSPVYPGLRWKVPFGIETIDQIKVSEQTATGNLEAFSADMQSIKITYSVMYRLPPETVPVLYGQYSGTTAEEWFRRQVEPRVDEITKQVTAMHRAQDLAQKRFENKEEILRRLKASIKVLDIREFTINNIDLDPKLKDSIEQKMIADQKAQAKEYELVEAKKQAEITTVEAKAKADALKITGEAAAGNPAVAAIEGIKKWDGKLPGTMVLGSLPDFGTSATKTTTPVILSAAK
jgi:regulator of protease activity HflC (stomatin/prohibitin superfamily)